MSTFFGIDLVSLIHAVGLFGIFAIVFAESGLLFGFFLPGDSLLFTAGFLASQGYINIWILAGGSFVAAVLGDNVGYAFGKRVGPRIFTRERSLFFRPEYLLRARHFYERHGGKALILARFMPAMRTFAPILAGVGAMDYPRFFTYNVIGGALWALGLPLIGYTLGNVVPNIDRYLIPIILGIIVLSSIPSIIAILRGRRSSDMPSSENSVGLEKRKE